jgi:hypothetical protein
VLILLVVLGHACLHCFPNLTCLPGWSLSDCSVFVPRLPPVFVVRPPKFSARPSRLFPQDDMVDIFVDGDTMTWFSRDIGKTNLKVRVDLRGTEALNSSSYHVHIVDGCFEGKRSFGLKSSQDVDPSLVRERLAQRFFEAVGCVVPRETFARVTMNGTNLVCFIFGLFSFF